MASPPQKKQKLESEDKPRWIKLQADSYEAVVSVEKVMEYPSSYLATRVQMELDKHKELHLDSSLYPSVRLDCDADEAREIVAVLRQGTRYEPPTDNMRLVRSLRHTLDFMGLPTPRFPCSSVNEVIMVPAYVTSCDYAQEEDLELVMYSAATKGWAPVKGGGPRPECVLLSGRKAERRWLAAVLRSEYTSAGEDVVCMLPRDAVEEPFQPRLLWASRKAASALPSPPQHSCCTDAALAAAGGKLYLLGGDNFGAEDVGHPSRLEVYEPHTGVWYTAGSPLPDNVLLVGHALVSNSSEGLLLALGGTARVPGAEGHAAAEADVWDSGMVASYDIRAGTWSKHPRGCTLPAADMPEGTSLAAAAAGEHTIMLLRSAPRVAVEAGAGQRPRMQQPPGRVDLLDLRKWRWREGAPLQRNNLHGVGLVEYDGKLLAVGGCLEPWPGNEHEEYVSLSVTDVVSCYDLRNDSWSELPARLPLQLGYATPVVVRTPGAQM